MLKNNKCKICRRLRTKLFLKGDKCLSPKCPMVRRPYPPGLRGKRRSRISDYGKQLQEKQKMRHFYNLYERELKKYVKKALEQRGRVGDTQGFLARQLEKRLDNVVYRLGFASSRPQARQLVSHKHFLVNGKSVNIPSYHIKKGDVISIVDPQKDVFKDLSIKLNRHQVPSWLRVDIKNLKGEVAGEPTIEEVALPTEVSTIFEYYSR